MKKKIALVLASVIVLSSILTACAGSKTQDATTTAVDSLNDAENVYVIDESIPVTDANGNVVTNANGEIETTYVDVQYDANGVGHVIDKNGNPVTNASGAEVTLTTRPTTEGADSNGNQIPTTASHSTTASTTVVTAGNESTTSPELTTIPTSQDQVPSTSESGTAVTLSTQDQQTIKAMLEVPYLYNYSYENAGGNIPVALAKHAALWMAERKNMSINTYASDDIILGLFVYFGQTVVGFKNNCNTDNSVSTIKYVSSNDSFKITNFENQTHTVSITRVEYLGNNNYYKVVGSVSGASGVTTVTAIMQKNRLDSSLGFSVKALQWS